MPKLIIACGGRDYADYDTVRYNIDNEWPTLLIQGGAKGADALARRAADELGIPHIEVPALWKKGKKAGYDRNLLMMKILLKLAGDNEKAVVAFPGGAGTKMMCDIAERYDVPVRKYGW